MSEGGREGGSSSLLIAIVVLKDRGMASTSGSTRAVRHLYAGLPLIAFVVLGHLGLSSMVRGPRRPP